MQGNGEAEPAVKLPVVGTALASYRFLMDHPRDAARVGWLPLIVIYALNLIFGAFEPLPGFSDPKAALGLIAPLLGKNVINVLIQLAVAAMTLVAWHRLVIQGYDVSARIVPMRAGIDELKYLARWMLISLLVMSIVVAVAIGVLLAVLLILLAIQLVAILVMGGAGLAPGELLPRVGQYVGLPAGMIVAIYLTTRLSLVLPATATGKEARFERAWYISRGNGVRMALASLIVTVPLQLVIWGLMRMTAYLSDTIFYYPLALLASAVFLLFILVAGTVLSLFSLGLDREPAEAVKP